MSAVLYLEGGASGADSKELQIRCREGFRKLLEKSGHKGRMPRLRLWLARHNFQHNGKAAGDYIATVDR